MPKLTATHADKKVVVDFEQGENVRTILDRSDMRVRSGCSGLGACGLCRIRVTEGNVNPPSESEHLTLGTTEIGRGVRLACQVAPTADATVSVINLASRSEWKSTVTDISPGNYKNNCSPPARFGSVHEPLGAAIDIGTTNVTIAVFSLRANTIISQRIAKNSQSPYGSDVISRLCAAAEDRKRAEDLHDLIVAQIGEGLMDIATREGISTEHIVSVGVVGNTPMLALFGNKNYAYLLDPARWDKYIDVLPEDAEEYIAAWRLHPDAGVYVIPPIAGFVGSDLVAGIVTSGVMRDSRPRALIDFGTNSEIALWDGKALWVTSASGGPAFEGTGISFGLPAVAGAIYRAEFRENDAWHFDIIDGGAAEGICGSGLIDILATLIDKGLLSVTGNLADGATRWDLPMETSRLYITKKDIDMVMRAKSAIMTGLLTLCRHAGIAVKDLEGIAIGGAFGKYLDVQNAQKIGLLPPMDSQTVTNLGNTAITGCVDVMRYCDARECIARIPGLSEIINMSHDSEFEMLFLENLYLRPPGALQ